jgi:hypothetical protein
MAVYINFSPRSLGLARCHAFAARLDVPKCSGRARAVGRAPGLLSYTLTASSDVRCAAVYQQFVAPDGFMRHPGTAMPLGLLTPTHPLLAAIPRPRMPSLQHPACNHCRTSKVKCEGGVPCERCIRINKGDSCRRHASQRHAKRNSTGQPTSVTGAPAVAAREGDSPASKDPEPSIKELANAVLGLSQAPRPPSVPPPMDAAAAPVSNSLAGDHAAAAHGQLVTATEAKLDAKHVAQDEKEPARLPEVETQAGPGAAAPALQ